MNRLHGKNILITGASSGIGRHFAKALCVQGATVIAAARRMSALDELAAEASGSGRILPLELDVTNVAGIDAAIAEAERKAGPLDVLVNNAGIAPVRRALETGVEEFDAMFSTNVRGSFFVAQAVARRMVATGRQGRIVNTASVAGMVVMPQLTAYGMTKAAVIHMTRCLAVEWARFGIAVNAICPGYVETELNADFLASEAGQKVVSGLPRRRAATVADLEAVLLMLVDSEAARCISGAAIPVDDAYSLM
ncbi:SDR family NAD(P)-dependent oxidoreductase [Nitrospirillum viridazoti]|uniref:NADP-dependent 3-hydroxy acid dehydrogenase YdfG n=1 Tax=Nitrospirillum amazonense TaxID=28077 RepID=A0A560HJZ3_9PROT|nr:SDR family NAD(P)-dependent oxidoreductase [Nitrospirillum amazonense]TWB46818.1 NADP-dependent 3-hydroxy acid dehydrogenase YdfG [Nitrospirillum amazonense]